jgi:hypothetical protein
MKFLNQLSPVKKLDKKYSIKSVDKTHKTASTKEVDKSPKSNASTNIGITTLTSSANPSSLKQLMRIAKGGTKLSSRQLKKEKNIRTSRKAKHRISSRSSHRIGDIALNVQKPLTDLEVTYYSYNLYNFITSTHLQQIIYIIRLST